MEHKIYKKIVLVVLDGFGVASSVHGNAISQAHTPNLDEMVANYPSMTLQASGPLVGLPWGEMGNSEVGHLNIGAGRIVGQDLPRITNAISSGEFFKNRVFIDAIEHAKKNRSKLHLVGMVSPGGVHSLDEHVYALLGMAGQRGLLDAYVHMFTDGRDTEPRVALETVKKLESKISEIGAGQIASITGRFYGMDRGGHWNQTELTYQVLVNGIGPTAYSAEECIRANYAKEIFDEMIPPTVITHQDGKPIAMISDNDSVIFINFRSDRAIQLVKMFVTPGDVPQEFRHAPFQDLFIVTMTEYMQGLPVPVAFPSVDLKNNLPEVISKNGFTQFHIAESEKYAHVTVFFNCGVSDKLPGEEREIVASPTDNLSNYGDHPEMSADLLASSLCEKISTGSFNFYIANFANGDIIGHTGNLQASIRAVEVLDKAVGKILEAVLAVDGVLIVTADHGNVEQMINLKTGDIDKDHTTNPVPCIIVAKEFKVSKQDDPPYQTLSGKIPSGVISDIAPTILDLFGLKTPPEMTGVNLLDELENE